MRGKYSLEWKSLARGIGGTGISGEKKGGKMIGKGGGMNGEGSRGFEDCMSADKKPIDNNRGKYSFHFLFSIFIYPTNLHIFAKNIGESVTGKKWGKSTLVGENDHVWRVGGGKGRVQALKLSYTPPLSQISIFQGNYSCFILR